MEIEMFALPALTVESIPQLVNFLRSDHYNFWASNVPAIFLTDSGRHTNNTRAHINNTTWTP